MRPLTCEAAWVAALALRWGPLPYGVVLARDLEAYFGALDFALLARLTPP